MVKHKIPDFEYQAEINGFYLTRFLDYEEQKEILSAKLDGYQVILFGGEFEAERKRAIIALKDISISNDLFEISFLKASFDKRFSSISHRHVLGTIMSLGLERNLIGDIFIENDDIIIVCTKDIVKFLINNLKEINHSNVEFMEIDSFIPSQSDEVERVINVPSLRLDAIISKGMNISRSEACEKINSGLVQINHLEITNDSKLCKVGDLLSIRKFGRILIKEIINTSKKDRLNIKVGIFR